MDLMNASQVLCSICQERLTEEGGRNVEAICTPCGHVYHKACLAEWFQKNEPQRRVLRDNPEELLRGECPICFKAQWLKRCIRIYLSCDDTDTTQLRALFDQMESELQDAKKQVGDSKKLVAETKLKLTQANVTIKDLESRLKKLEKTTKNAPAEINNNCRKKTAPTSTSSSSEPATKVRTTRTSTARAAVAKAAATSRKASDASKAKATSSATALATSVVKLRQHSKLVAKLSSDSDTASVASSGSTYSPPQGVQKAPIVRRAVMTRSKAAAAATSSVSNRTSSGNTASRTLRTGVVGNPFSLHR